MERDLREITFEEEYTFLKKEAKELFDKEDKESEPPESHSGVCDCNNCSNCKKYISVNSDKGMELYEKYQADVEEALKPLSEKWNRLKAHGENEQIV